jgi:hypothetical protein
MNTPSLPLESDRVPGLASISGISEDQLASLHLQVVGQARHPRREVLTYNRLQTRMDSQ